MVILNGSDQWSKDFFAYLYPRFRRRSWSAINIKHIIEFLPNSKYYAGIIFYKGLSDADRYMIEMALLGKGAVMISQYPPDFNSLLPVVVDDPEFYTKDFVCERALNKLMDQQAFKWSENSSTQNATGGIFKNQIMIVGEATKPDRPQAFISEKGCSRFLHGCLLANTHSRYYLTNAQKTGLQNDDIAYLQMEILRVQPSKIIAMGKVAAKMLSLTGATFAETYHPQYWKRFKFSERKSLIKILKHDQVKDRTSTAI